MWCWTYRSIWDKWRHSARNYHFYLCNLISQSFLANVSTVTCWSNSPPSKFNVSHIKHCFLFVVFNIKASNCKWSTAIAWAIMREWATILHSHTHTCTTHTQAVNHKINRWNLQKIWRQKKLSPGWFPPQRKRQRQVKGSFETLGK